MTPPRCPAQSLRSNQEPKLWGHPPTPSLLRPSFHCSRFTFPESSKVLKANAVLQVHKRDKHATWSACWNQLMREQKQSEHLCSRESRLHSANPCCAVPPPASCAEADERQLTGSCPYWSPSALGEARGQEASDALVREQR